MYIKYIKWLVVESVVHPVHSVCLYYYRKYTVFDTTSTRPPFHNLEAIKLLSTTTALVYLQALWVLVMLNTAYVTNKGIVSHIVVQV